MGDVVDFHSRQSPEPFDPIAKAEADGDPVLAAMLLFGDDLLWMIPDGLDARAIVHVAAIVLLDQLRDELPDDLITALEACRR